MKICFKCKKEKELSEFYKNKKDGYSSYCILCNAEYNKLYNKLNKDSIKKYKKQYRLINRVKTKKYKKNYYRFHKNQTKLYYKLNKEKNSEYCKSYYKKNKNKLDNNTKKYKRNLYNTNSNFKITQLLRNRLHSSIKKNKSNNTIKLTGCSIDQLKEHLQSTAISNGYKNFNINNYSGKEYHIDHKIPVSKFNLKCSYHQKLCFNWSNMQILKANKNRIKYNKI